MGTTIPTEIAGQLTVPELLAIANEHGYEVRQKPKPAVLEDVLKAATDEQIVAALKANGHDLPEIDAKPATTSSDASSSDNENAKPAAPSSKPAAAPIATGKPSFLEDDDDDLPGVAAVKDDRVLDFTEDDLPKLADLGARIREVKRQTPNRGENPGTWWCPWTDASKLKSDGVDQMPQSQAIRVGSYAVVLPPAGVTKRQLGRK